jgi:hypothetical protein
VEEAKPKIPYVDKIRKDSSTCLQLGGLNPEQLDKIEMGNKIN